MKAKDKKEKKMYCSTLGFFKGGLDGVNDVDGD